MVNEFVQEVVVLVLGKQYENIGELLDSKNHVNEFILSKKMDLTINQTRNLLYRLADHGLVSSIRKKDKKKGWYTYFWRIENLRVLEFLKDILEKRIEQFKKHIQNREANQFYVCNTCNVEFSEENALLCDFTCNECGAVFEVKDNAKLVREMSKNLDKLNFQLNRVNEEIGKHHEKLGKEREKEEKKRKEEKKLARQNSAKKSAQTKAAKKKVVIKVAKKKVVKKKIVKKITKKKIVKKKK